jgi:hypothetical protein
MHYYEHMKEWLQERAPVDFSNQDIRYINSKLQRSRLTPKIKEIRQRARLGVQWRESLSDRLRIQTDDVVRATNTILELIEQTLSAGHHVRLANFGDLVLINSTTDERKYVRFRPAKTWLEEINEPQWQKDIGLKRRFVKGKLTRRSD